MNFALAGSEVNLQNLDEQNRVAIEF